MGRPCNGIEGLLKQLVIKHDLSNISTQFRCQRTYTHSAVTNITGPHPVVSRRSWRISPAENWRMVQSKWPIKRIQKSHVWTHNDGHTYIPRTFKEQKRNFIYWINISETAGEYSKYSCSQSTKRDVCSLYVWLWLVDFKDHRYELWIKWKHHEFYATTWTWSYI